MVKTSVDVLISGGKATAAPPLGPALGPLGVNIGQVVVEINKKTESFKGMQVPVKVTVDSETKTFTISIGTPPASALIKKEAGVEKGSSNPLSDKVADLKIEQIIKIARMKEDALLGKDTKQKVKEIVGTCDSMGILVEGKQGRATIKDINAGVYDTKIKSGKTELTAEEIKAQAEEKKKLKEEFEAKRAGFEASARSVINSMSKKPRNTIKAKLIEMKIPSTIIEELLPAENVAKKPAAAKTKK